MLNKFLEQMATFLLLVYKTRSQSPSYMSLNVKQLEWILGHQVVPRPTNVPFIYPLHCELQRQICAPWYQIFNFFALHVS